MNTQVGGETHLILNQTKYTSSLKIPSDIVEGLMASDREAFNELYLLISDPLLGFINSIIRNEDDSKEILQETLMYIWEKRKNIDFSDNIKGFLYKCAKNKTMDYFKHKNVEQKYYPLVDYNTEGELSHDHVVVARETELIIRLAIEGMPSQRKRIFKMSHEDAMSVADIAKELELTPSTVREHISIAKEGIRNALFIFITLFILP